MADHVCPVWLGYLLANPLRKLFQNPNKILKPHIKDGMTVLDFGCAMGFFSLPAAGMVGAGGRVICVDAQERMLELLIRRAGKENLQNRLEPRISRDTAYGIADLGDRIDFALAFAVVHEVPDARALLSCIYNSLKPGGSLLVSEPKMHVRKKDLDSLLSVAVDIGFSIADRPKIPISMSVLFKKQ